MRIEPGKNPQSTRLAVSGSGDEGRFTYPPQRRSPVLKKHSPHLRPSTSQPSSPESTLLASITTPQPAAPDLLRDPASKPSSTLDKFGSQHLSSSLPHLKPSNLTSNNVTDTSRPDLHRLKNRSIESLRSSHLLCYFYELDSLRLELRALIILSTSAQPLTHLVYSDRNQCSQPSSPELPTMNGQVGDQEQPPEDEIEKKFIAQAAHLWARALLLRNTTSPNWRALGQMERQMIIYAMPQVKLPQIHQLQKRHLQVPEAEYRRGCPSILQDDPDISGYTDEELAEQHLVMMGTYKPTVRNLASAPLPVRENDGHRVVAWIPADRSGTPLQQLPLGSPPEVELFVLGSPTLSSAGETFRGSRANCVVLRAWDDVDYNEDIKLDAQFVHWVDGTYGLGVFNGECDELQLYWYTAYRLLVQNYSARE